MNAALRESMDRASLEQVVRKVVREELQSALALPPDFSTQARQEKP